MQDRFSGVDPARLALASLGTNTNGLLHTFTGPGPHWQYKTENAPLKETFSAVPNFDPCVYKPCWCCIISIIEIIILSIAPVDN